MTATEVATVDALFDHGGLVVPLLGEVVRSRGRVRLGHDGRLYRYVNGVYRPDGEAFAKVVTRETLGNRWKRRHLEEVVAWLKSDTAWLGERPPADVINVNNGLLRWSTGELLEHAPDVPSIVQLPLPWRPEARCPRIIAFLEETVGEEVVPMVIEIVGYSMYAGNPLRKAVLLLGQGRNGKSVLLAIIRSVLGFDNVSAVPLQQFAENRFAPAELFGKLANICGDLDARAITRSDVFKMVTGGDPVLAERKYGQAFSYIPFALPLFSANEAPISSDQTDAWFDRWIVVPFERRLEEHEVDPHLTAKLTAPAELEGLVVLAVEGLRRLMARGRFELPDSVRRAGEAYRDRLDTVRAFVTEQCVFEEDQWISRPLLYKAYKEWATESGRRPLSAVSFNEHVVRNYPTVTERTRQGHRGWGGVRLMAG